MIPLGPFHIGLTFPPRRVGRGWRIYLLGFGNRAFYYRNRPTATLLERAARLEEWLA